jgi:hypothetical protein
MVFVREVVSLEGDTLVVFYYLSAAEIWLDKRGLTFVTLYQRRKLLKVKHSCHTVIL